MPKRGGYVEVKRRFERIHFEHSLTGRLSDQPIRVLDLAIAGARVLSQTRFTPGSSQQMRIDWDGNVLRMNCTVTRCKLEAFAKGNEKSTYEIGVRIVEMLDDADQKVRELIHTYVMKALDEQRANWEGIPPIGPYVHLEGKSDHYRRCEFFNGGWNVSPTTRPDQPVNGFTVSAEVPPHYIDLLCDTYERADIEGRRLTRLLAELSISKAEGVPTRRYIP